MDGWAELDALVAELQEVNSAWAESAGRLAGEASTLGKLVEDVERFYTDLGVRDALNALADQALVGAASVYEARRAFGYTRTATLAWQAADDPRAALADEAPSAWLSVDVLIGPHMLVGGEAGGVPDDRLAVVIVGEKRQAATLPTSRERFRGALLRAFAAPRREAKASAGTPSGTPANEPSGETPPRPPAEAASAPDEQPEPPPARAEAGPDLSAAAAFAGEVAADRAGERPAEGDAGPPSVDTGSSQAKPAPHDTEHEDERIKTKQAGRDADAHPATSADTVIELPGAGSETASENGPPNGNA